MQEKSVVTYELHSLPDDLRRADYHGYHLKKGFWYGTSSTGEYVVTSANVVDGDVELLIKKEKGAWGHRYVPISNTGIFGSDFLDYIYQRALRIVNARNHFDPNYFHSIQTLELLDEINKEELI